MQLVLLSGGSGKRLWPLSNNARSKQFLPLLEKADGTMESMVQRVVRQVLEANLTNNITLATNARPYMVTKPSFAPKFRNSWDITELRSWSIRICANFENEIGKILSSTIKQDETSEFTKGGDWNA